MKDCIEAAFKGLAALFRPESTSMDDKIDKLLTLMASAQNEHEDWITDYREVKSILIREAQRRWDFARRWSMFVGGTLIACFIAVTLKFVGVF